MADTPKSEGSDPQSPSVSGLERLGSFLDTIRNALVRTYRLASLLAKGAFIVGERRRLFVKLGEQVYYKISKGEMRSAELEPVVQQLDRLTKKIELEEILVRSIRFGKRPPRPSERREETQE